MLSGSSAAPALEAGERQHDRIRGFVDLRRDAVAGLDAAVDERARRPPGAGEQLGIGQRQAVGRLDRQLVEARRARRATGRRDWRTSGRVSALALTNRRRRRAAGRAALARQSLLRSRRRRV